MIFKLKILKTMKKIKLFALAAFAMLSTNALAQSEVDKTFIGSNGVEYQITADYQAASAGNPEVLGQVTVIRYAYSSQTTAVTIPEQVQNLDNSVAVDLTHKFKVVGIDGAETGAVTINTTFKVNTTTAHQPFKDCAATSVTLPATLMYIGQKAFEGFKGTTVGIPTMSNLVQIDKGAFANAASLATFATENATWLAEVDEDAFYGCAKLTAFSVGAKLTDIKAGAFVGTAITSLDLSACVLLNSVNRLFTGTGTFASTLTLGTATSYVLADGSNAKLTTVVLPTTTGTYPINADAFNGCSKLATIGATASSAIIPAKVSSIGTRAFQNTAITKFDLSGNSAISNIDKWFSSNPGGGLPDPSKLEQLILKATGVNYTFNVGTATTGLSLANISTLKKVGIPDAEYKLPASATLKAGMFAGTALVQLDLTAVPTVTTANTLDALFGTDGISTLTTVALPQALTKLAAGAFYNCTALETLSVKDKTDLSTIVEVGNGALYRTKLATLTFGSALTTLTTPFLGTKTDTGGNLLPFSTATAITIDLSKATALNGTNVAIMANTFQNLAALTSITLPTNIKYIGANAFEGTGIAEITLPATIVQHATAASRGLLAQVFKNCKSLKKVTYMPTGVPAGSIFSADDVFSGCGLVSIYTTEDYAKVGGVASDNKAPTNSKWVTASPVEFTTVKDKVRNYAMKGFFNSTAAYQFDATECQVYEAYLDGTDIVMSELRKRNGKYNVKANQAVIVRTAEAKKISPVAVTIDDSAMPAAGTVKSSNVYGNNPDLSYAPTSTENILASVAAETARESVTGYGNYMYVLVNNATAGFSFQYFTGTKINNGNIYVVINKAPTSAGRLNIVWKDENGNIIEDEATAIKAIEAAEAENGAIYNLQGVRVNAAKKGLYIKNGKKFIIK